MKTDQLIALIKSRQGARFISFPYRAKSSGEFARYTVILGGKYENTVKDSLLELELLNLQDIQDEFDQKLGRIESNIFSKEKVSEDLFSVAKAELQSSFEATLQGDNPAFTKQGIYLPVCEGIKENRNDGTLELFGLEHSKVVLEKGEYKKVNSAPKTIAKNLIKKYLKVGKFRSFSLDSETIKSIKLEGETLILE
jgi:hypothetical protein